MACPSAKDQALIAEIFKYIGLMSRQDIQKRTVFYFAEPATSERVNANITARNPRREYRNGFTEIHIGRGSGWGN